MEKREPPAEDSASGPSRLPRGRHGLPRELVLENQRERLISGLIDAVAERGYNETKIADIIEAAGLSRRTFYEHFSNKEDCFAAAYESTFAYIRESMRATDMEKEWTDRVGDGLASLLEVLATHPSLARFFLIAPASVGDEIVDRHHVAMLELVSALVEGSPEPADSIDASETRAQALAGGLSRLVVAKLNAGQAERLRELLPDLVELVLRPYVGSDEAVRLAGESG